MRTVGLRQASELGSVKLYREHVLLFVVSLVGGEIYRLIVHGLERQDFVVSFFQLPLQLGLCPQRLLLVETVQIQVSMPIPPTRPQKAIA